MRLLEMLRLPIIKIGILHRDLADQRYDADPEEDTRLNDNVQQCWQSMSFQYNVPMFSDRIAVSRRESGQGSLYGRPGWLAPVGNNRHCDDFRVLA